MAQTAEQDSVPGSLVRLALGAVLAAFVLYLAGLGYWREALPNTAISSIYDENEFIRVLEGSFPDSGTYMIPGPDDSVETVKELRRIGPIATLHVLNRRDIPSTRSIVLYRWLQLIATTFILGWVIRKFPRGRHYLRSRVIAVSLMGLAVAIYSDLADPVWWYQPWSWGLAKAGYDFFSWTAAGLVLAQDWFHPSQQNSQKEAKPATG